MWARPQHARTRAHTLTQAELTRVKMCGGRVAPGVKNGSLIVFNIVIFIDR